MHRGFIRLWRKLDEWRWYRSSETLHLFIHLLLHANYKKTEFMGINVYRGQIVTGRKKLSEDTGITEQSIRTALNRLISTNEITIKPTNKFSIITLCNYETYNSDSNDNQPTHQPEEQPTTNQQLTNNQPHLKKDKKEKNIIPPVFEWVKRYCSERGGVVNPRKWFDFYESKGWMVGKNKMKDWQSAVRTWEPENKQKEEGKQYRILQ